MHIRNLRLNFIYITYTLRINFHMLKISKYSNIKVISFFTDIL